MKFFPGGMDPAPLDKALVQFARKKDAIWLRYVDDIKVFTKTFNDAREAVFLINASLRDLHLNLQGSKTEILHGADLEHELVDPALARINELIERARKASSNKREVTISLSANHKK